MGKSRIKEGDVYGIFKIGEDTFEIRYGYYDESDRIGKYNDPIPIYPNFIKNPQYNSEGYPFVTEMQDICEHFEGQLLVDICCGCTHFKKGDDLIGICQCEKKRQMLHKNSSQNQF